MEVSYEIANEGILHIVIIKNIDDFISSNFTTIRTLSIVLNGNIISSISRLPINLIYFNCTDCNLSALPELPELPEGLEVLYCQTKQDFATSKTAKIFKIFKL
jgi:hypothetical protein